MVSNCIMPRRYAQTLPRTRNRPTTLEHNFMAHQISSLLLGQLRTGDAAAWATSKLSKASTLWQGKADWPRPDIAFEDRTSGSAFAIEFKPPNHAKREYVTGLGQAITYLNDFEFSGLVVPELSGDGFRIGDYLLDILDGDLSPLSIALFTYDLDPKQIKVRRKLKERESPPAGIPQGVGRKVFWGYWRDLSRYDLFELVRLADQSNTKSFDDIFQRFWTSFAVKGKARTWEGKRRKKKDKDAPSYSAERLNAWLAMRHSGILSDDAHLTALGHELLRVGKIYGPSSMAFSDVISRLVLIEGSHLELMFWVEEQNRLLSSARKVTSDKYFGALDRALVEAGVIAPRIKGAAKAHFLRDEPKLWNKLGLLVRDGNTRYYHKGVGLAFDWRKVISVLGEGEAG